MQECLAPLDDWKRMAPTQKRGINLDGEELGDIRPQESRVWEESLFYGLLCVRWPVFRISILLGKGFDGCNQNRIVANKLPVIVREAQEALARSKTARSGPIGDSCNLFRIHREVITGDYVARKRYLRLFKEAFLCFTIKPIFRKTLKDCKDMKSVRRNIWRKNKKIKMSSR